jgi:hypothetical protein
MKHYDITLAHAASSSLYAHLCCVQVSRAVCNFNRPAFTQEIPGIFWKLLRCYCPRNSPTWSVLKCSNIIHTFCLFLLDPLMSSYHIHPRLLSRFFSEASFRKSCALLSLSIVVACSGLTLFFHSIYSFSNEYNLRKTSFRSFLQIPVTACLVGVNVLLSNLSSNIKVLSA